MCREGHGPSEGVSEHSFYPQLPQASSSSLTCDFGTHPQMALSYACGYTPLLIRKPVIGAGDPACSIVTSS